MARLALAVVACLLLSSAAAEVSYNMGLDELKKVSDSKNTTDALPLLSHFLRLQLTPFPALSVSRNAALPSDALALSRGGCGSDYAHGHCL